MYRPMWPFLLMYGSHDMRHTGFPQVNGGQQDLRNLGRHTFRYTRRRRSFEAVSTKKAELWP